MRSRRILALVIPFACAALFVRLGAWQLSRLRERLAFNAMLAARLSAPPVDVAALPADTALGHYRRASASGALLYDRQVAYAGRVHEGSPGADLLTPLAVAGRDTVVMVNRGWVYSADAATVEFARWRERDSTSVAGFAETYTAGKEGGTAASGQPSAERARKRVVHGLDRAAVERLVGRPVAPYVLVQTSDSASSPRRDSVPVRLALPSLGEGPHRSYAVQWFSFAAIAVVGGVVLYRRAGAQ